MTNQMPARANPYQPPTAMPSPVELMRNQMQSRVSEQFQNFIPQPQSQPQYQYLPCVIVDSIDQFRAMPASPDGSVTLFSNLANGRIYMNRLDKNTNELFMSEFILNEKPIRPISNFVPQSEFDDLKTQVSETNNMLRELIGGMKNANEQLRTTDNEPTATNEPTKPVRSTNSNNANAKNGTDSTTGATVSTSPKNAKSN